MATGFMIGRCFARGDKRRGVSDFTLGALLCLCFGVGPLYAVDVGLAGLFPGKALLTINGGKPRTVAVGVLTEEGVKVLSTEGEFATLEVEGKRRVLRVGQNVAEQPAASGPPVAILTADGQGHFLTHGTINGKTVRLLVDTGASLISLGAGDARRLGIDASKGQSRISSTANGPALASQVKLDTVKIGDIVLNNVDALVHPLDMPFVLLGMSFLNRMEMRRDGSTMTLTKRY
jgi:aspartyl protease family protein